MQQPYAAPLSQALRCPSHAASSSVVLDTTLSDVENLSLLFSTDVAHSIVQLNVSAGTWSPAVCQTSAVIALQQRTEAPPIFINPIMNKIPGNILGPDDLPQ